MQSLGWDGDWRITQGFGEHPEIYGPAFGLRGHNGTDVGLPDGTALYAPEAGTVSGVSYDARGYGWHVRVRTGDGREWLYGHMTRVDVHEGDWVDQGQYLGLSDNTGYSSGPHVHIGTRPAGANMGNGFSGYEDPLPLLQSLGTTPGQAIVSPLPEDGGAEDAGVASKLPVVALAAGAIAALWLVLS